MKIISVSSFRKLFLSAERTQYKIAGLDMGSKNIGVALANETKTSVVPYGILVRSQPRMAEESLLKLSGHLQKFVTENNVGGFVVGFPLLESGDITPFCEEIVEIINKVECNVPGKKNVSVRCTFWDERGSTVTAKNMSREFTARRSVLMKHKDTYAACVILKNMINCETTI